MSQYSKFVEVNGSITIDLLTLFCYPVVIILNQQKLLLTVFKLIKNKTNARYFETKLGSELPLLRGLKSII